MAYKSMDVSRNELYLDIGCGSHKQTKEVEEQAVKVKEVITAVIESAPTLTTTTEEKSEVPILETSKEVVVEEVVNKLPKTDKGGEFTSTEFYQSDEKEVIHHKMAIAYTREESGVVKRNNKAMVEMAKSTMKQKGLSNKFWGDIVRSTIFLFFIYAVYLLNIFPMKTVMIKTSYEAWCGQKPSVSHLKVFGSMCYALIDAPNRKKLDEKSRKCIFIGCSTQSKGYRLYDPVNGKIIENRNVIFDENAIWKWSTDENGDSVEVITEENDEQGGNQDVENIVDITPTTPNYISSTENETIDEEGSSSSWPTQKFISLQEIYKQPQVFSCADLANFKEAVKKQEWLNAMKEELSSIEKNKTWELGKLLDTNSIEAEYIAAVVDPGGLQKPPRSKQL